MQNALGRIFHQALVHKARTGTPSLHDSCISTLFDDRRNAAVLLDVLGTGETHAITVKGTQEPCAVNAASARQTAEDEGNFMSIKASLDFGIEAPMAALSCFNCPAILLPSGYQSVLLRLTAISSLTREHSVSTVLSGERAVQFLVP